ncbi:MAG: hypothetical protein JJ895_05025 [Balneolaceae bacterium]|nr:hypothetical protein [Balneolaceae bacterium]
MQLENTPVNTKPIKHIKPLALFQDIVSYYMGFGSKPKPIPLSSWLKACKERNRYADKVLAYRICFEPSIKKNLPMITVGGLFEGGRKLTHLIKPTGWIALDIDAKDNPNLPPAEELKRELSNIENLAAISLSVSGRGVWALIKVRYPEKQKEHFGMIMNDFESLGIKLDRTKGANPNDARFYSYDPYLIINPDFKVYEKLPSKVMTTQSALNYDKSFSESYVKTVIQGELTRISEAPMGSRNSTLFKSSKRISDFVKSGALERESAVDMIHHSALWTGLCETEIHQTINSAFSGL